MATPANPHFLSTAIGQPPVRPRPALFRALGPREPPETIHLDGEEFYRTEILKHDSWAASAIYASPSRVAFCKFNREQPVLILPMEWLGRLLGSREQWFMDRLAGIEGIPVSLGPIVAAGRPVPNAVSHLYIEGQALGEGQWVDDSFFPRLERIVAEMHARGVAHVDLNKRENILVDSLGRPHLLDYQISWALPPQSRLARLLLGWLTAILQQCDSYHLLKHRCRHRRDQLRQSDAELDSLRPWWIRLHRLVGVPFRTSRRALLVALGIRSRSGRSASEVFPELAHRRLPAAGG